MRRTRCGRCYHPKAEESGAYCDGCLRYFRERRRRWAEGGYCMGCGGEPRPGKRRCFECLMKESRHDVTRRLRAKKVA